MKWVPFPVISAAKEYDLYGNEKSFLDDERYSEAQTAMLSAIFSFDFREPPEDYHAG